MKIRLFIILTFCCVITNYSQQSKWYWQNPLPHGNSNYGVHVLEPGHVIIAGNASTIIKTKDFGETWDIQHNIAGTKQFLFDIFFSTEDTGWAVGENGIVLKTVDAGITWIKLRSVMNEQLYKIQFIDSYTGWMVGMANPPGDALVYKTTDGGLSWSAIPIGLDGIATTCMYFVNAMTGWIVVDAGPAGPIISHILKTTNGGDSWEIQNIYEGPIFNIQFANSSVGWWSGGQGKIMMTTDGGESWNLQTSGTGQSLYGMHIKDEKHGWAVSEGGEILKMSDGIHWQQQNSGTTDRLNTVYFLDTLNGCVVGNAGKILITTDGGFTWGSKIHGTTDDLTDIVFTADKIGWAVGGNNYSLSGGVIFKTTNFGRDWNTVSTVGSPLQSLSFPTEEKGWAVGLFGEIVHTTDRGNTWHYQTSGTSLSLLSVQFMDTSRGYAVGGQEIDWVESQEEKYPSLRNRVVQRSSSEKLSTSVILKTDNGGQDWQILPHDFGATLYSVFFINRDTGWTAGINYEIGQSIISKTTDGGSTWTQTTISYESIYEIKFVSPLLGFAGGGYYWNGRLYRTIDGGNTWSLFAEGLSSSIRAMTFLDSTFGYAAVRWGDIYATTNGGKNWLAQLSPNGNSLRGITFVDADTGFAVGDGGTILVTRNASSPLLPYQPMLSRPPNNSEIDKNATVIAWNQAYNALRYQLEVSEDSLFEEDVLLDTILTRTFIIASFLSEGTKYYWRVRSLNDTKISQWSEIWSFRTTPFFQYHYNVEKRWNLLSLPLQVPDWRKSAIFPTSSSDVFTFTSDGNYERQDTLENGKGFWLKFPSAQLVTLLGKKNTFDTIDVREGWNLIGSVQDTLSTSMITTFPSNIVVSEYYEFTKLYKTTGTLLPLHGYWVKVSTDGKLILSSESRAFEKERPVSVNAQLEDAAQIVFTDTEGNQQRLFIDGGTTMNIPESYFEFPPVPPQGCFDVRFATQKQVENISNGGTTFLKILLSSTSYPITVNWLQQKKNITAKLQIGSQVADLIQKKNYIIEHDNNEIVLQVTSKENVPNCYSLEQNYPNPFNPTTVVRYQLSVNSLVTLKVYDMLGRVIATLADEVQDAGYKSIEFDASNLPSGIYFYRLTALPASNGSNVPSSNSGEMFTDMKKMLLLK
ncbi:MAG: T9SS type A sorting domain-containing protein [Ignavibacteriae bacterium]|nr:T9SS type A sorting domain-containing protein [Ignavibacteriota bacterium]